MLPELMNSIMQKLSVGILERYHHKLTLQAQDFADWIPKFVWHLDEPVGDAACIPLYFLAKYAKERATVLQSGEGADEIFAGYSIYKKMELMNRCKAGPSSPACRTLSAQHLPICRNWEDWRDISASWKAAGRTLSWRVRSLYGRHRETAD